MFKNCVFTVKHESGLFHHRQGKYIFKIPDTYSFSCFVRMGSSPSLGLQIGHCYAVEQMVVVLRTVVNYCHLDDTCWDYKGVTANERSQSY
jgi:hypothetical protein